MQGTGPVQAGRLRGYACVPTRSDKHAPTTGEHTMTLLERIEQVRSAREHDIWGIPIVLPDDGHSAWSCNDRDCYRHPASIYGPVVGTVTSECAYCGVVDCPNPL